VRGALGVTATGAVAIRGLWSGVAGSAIGRALQAQEGRRVLLLVQDGKLKLAMGGGPAGRRIQRDHRHLVTGLDQPLRDDHGPQAHRRGWQWVLGRLIAVPLPTRRQPGACARLRQTVRQRTALRAAIGDLWEADGWEKGAAYLRHALPEVFTYVTVWMATGWRLPRTTALIESVMSQRVPRLKAIGRNGRAAGVAKLARLILRCRRHADVWTA
jgi:hypothetical protein